MDKILIMKMYFVMLVVLYLPACTSVSYNKPNLYDGIITGSSKSPESFKEGRRLAVVLSKNSEKTLDQLHNLQKKVAIKTNDESIKTLDITNFITLASGLISQKFSSVEYFQDIQSVPKNKFEYLGVLDIVVYEDYKRCDIKLGLLDTKSQLIGEVEGVGTGADMRGTDLYPPLTAYPIVQAYLNSLNNFKTSFDSFVANK